MEFTITRTIYWLDTPIGRIKVILDPTMPKNFIGFTYENGGVQVVGYNPANWSCPVTAVGG